VLPMCPVKTVTHLPGCTVRGLSMNVLKHILGLS
jgi:hypothetical protein